MQPPADPPRSATPERDHSPAQPPRARRRGAAAGAVLVVLAAAAALQLPGSAPPASPANTTRDMTVGERQAVLAEAQAAIGAWGDFATTGDTSALAAHFDPRGPQHRQLLGEAAGRAADPAAYRMTLTALAARPDGDRWLVDARVRLRRDGQPAGTWRWRLELRHDRARGWRIWTVTAPDHQPGT
jgi:hypothetical protein